MIKVIHLITDLNSGGAERMLTKLVTHGQGDKVEHVVVSMMDAGFFGSDIEKAGVRLYTLNMPQGRPALSGFFRFIGILRQERPDIVQTWLYHADLLGLIAAKLTGIKRIVWNVRCSNMHMQRYSRLSRLVLSSLVWLSSVPVGVIVNSNAGREEHIKLGYRPRQWELIPNGFDLAAFKPVSKARSAFRKAVGVSSRAVLFGMIARFDEMKDHAGCLEALAKLVQKHADVHFVFAGSGCAVNGPLHDLVSSRGLDDYVTLLGECHNVDEVLQGLDALVLSSAYGEGFPNVVGEAMAVEVPVVVTDVGDSRNLVADGGVVVPPKDPAALSAALLGLIDMRAEGRQELGERGRQRIEADFSIEAVVGRYETYYLQLGQG